LSDPPDLPDLPDLPSAQNWNRTANSAWRDGALMFGSSDVLWPNSGRPVLSLAALTLPFAMLKLARLKMLNSCAISSMRWPPNTKDFDSRRSTLANPGQSTWVTAVRPRAVRAALTASRLRSRQPLPGSTPAGRSPVYPSLFRSPNDTLGANRRTGRKSPRAG